MEARSPEDTQEIQFGESLQLKLNPEEVDEIDLEESRRAFEDLFHDLGGVVLNIDDVEDDI